MFETDRDMYLALARTLNLDFHRLGELVDGRRGASPELARALANVTGSKPGQWMGEGQAALRLISLKIWYLKQGRPAMNVNEAWPPPHKTRCPNCD